MGSGKSNTALNLAGRLGKAGLPAEAVTEGTDPHPVRGTDGLEHWHKPWLDITPPELAERCLAKWRGYVQGALATETLCILDGQFFHGDFTNLFLMDAGTEALEKYCKALEEIIQPLEPLLVYFHQDDFGRTIRDVSAERGEKWVRYQLDWKLQTPYSLRFGFEGLDGLIELYRHYRALTDRLCAGLRMDKLSIENSQRAWETYYQRIEAAL